MTKEEIYKEYHDKVLHLITGKINNLTEAEDLTSEVFIKVYGKLDTFDDSKASISTWIYRIAQNTLIDYYRTRKVHSEIPEEIAEDGHIDDGLLNEETLDSLANALSKLSERDRGLIILHYYKGMTLKEAALKIGMSYSNAKIVHGKAISQLKMYLDGLI